MRFDTLDWSLLSQNGCPKGGNELTEWSDESECKECGFKISKEKMQKIIEDRK